MDNIEKLCTERLTINLVKKKKNRFINSTVVVEQTIIITICIDSIELAGKANTRRYILFVIILLIFGFTELYFILYLCQ